MMRYVEVAPDGWTFRYRGTSERFVPFGTNAVMVRSARPNPPHPAYFIMRDTDWDPALFAIFLDHVVEVGMNVVKVFLPISIVLPDPQPGPGARIAPLAFEMLDQALQLAAERGVYLMPTLSEWGGIGLDWWHACGEYVGRVPGMEPGPDAPSIVCDYWRQIAARYRDVPAVLAWNLAVEWLMPNGNMSHAHPVDGIGVLTHPGADAAWRHWLELRYGTVTELERSWRRGIRDFGSLSTPTYAFEEGRYVEGEQAVYDYTEFREWVCYRYLKAQADAIRSVDGQHMVTCGLDPRKPYGLGEHTGGKPGARLFGGYSPRELDFLDFHPMHEYVIEGKDEGYQDRPDEDGTRMRRAAVNHLRFCYTGKPVILEEFGHQGRFDPEANAEQGELLIRESAVACGGWLVWFFVEPESTLAPYAQGVFAVDDEDLMKGKWSLTPWGRRLARLAERGGFIDSLPAERPAARQVVEFDRRRELTPTGPTSAGYLVDHWDEYAHPLDFVWPGNPHLRLGQG